MVRERRWRARAGVTTGSARSLPAGVTALRVGVSVGLSVHTALSALQSRRRERLCSDAATVLSAAEHRRCAADIVILRLTLASHSSANPFH